MSNTPSSPCCQSFPWIGYLFFVVVLVGTIVLGILVVQVTQRRAEAVKRNIIFPIPPAEMDAAVWGKNFPRQYESWQRTQLETPATKYGGSNPRDYLRGKPAYVVLFAGIGFSKEYIQGRGHWFAIDDVSKTLRINDKSTAACWQCKSPDAVRLIDEMGVEEFSAKKFHELKEQVTHAISCYDCHDETTMALRSLRPNILEGFKSMGQDMAKLSHQEKRSAICAQCHSSYHFAEGTGVVTFPWSKGLLAENVEEYYKETEFSDWTHPISGAKMIKTRHPDYELYTTSLHYARNVSCSDCHSPYKTEGAEKFSDHHVRSPSVAPNHPLSAIANTCSVCHRWSEYDAKKQIELIQTKVEEVQNRGMTALVLAHFDIAACKEAEATDEELAAVREELRYAQMHWDFVASSNAMGFHAPQESQRILATALDRAAKVRVACAQILAKHGYAEDVLYPEVNTKAKAQAVIEKFIAGEKPSLLKKGEPSQPESAPQPESATQPEPPAESAKESAE
jgi:nitrite reductase (cytochrome c-552)